MTNAEDQCQWARVSAIVKRIRAYERKATTKPPRIEQWGWWSDGFGWQSEDTALVAMTLVIIVLGSALALWSRLTFYP